MAYIYLDESGDLGFDFSKKKTSKYFVITFLFVDDEKKKKQVDKIVKKIFSKFSKKEVKFHNGCLHAYKEKSKTRSFLLQRLAGLDISIMSICLNKKNVYTRLKDERHFLYNYITNILLDRICKKKFLSTSKKIELIASQRETNKFLNQNFKSYLERQVKNNHNLNIEVTIKPFHSNKCLQVVDFVSWSIFRHREHDDNFYRNIIKEKITEENNLFP